eukprot:GHVR01141889.1.p1 GENE.GHVR01141889.1~~GHVR01141889.1.p1  ORF type:complete len:127 (+),score=30.54 GHVR01141889.1:314-694(+)
MCKIFKTYDMDANNVIDFGEFVIALSETDIKCLKESMSGYDDVDLQLEFDKYSAVAAVDNSLKVIKKEGVRRLMEENAFTVVTDTDINVLFNRLVSEGVVKGDESIEPKDTDTSLQLSNFKAFFRK